MAAVVKLPTAAPREVANPAPSLSCRRAIRAQVEAGNLLAFPGRWKSPDQRRAEAERAERAELLQEGGITRNGTTFLVGALLLAMSDDQRERALANLTLVASELSEDPAACAALAYARSLVGGRQ